MGVSALVASGLLALAGGLVLACLGLAPYAAWSYRKYGSISLGRVSLFVALVLYASAFVAYALFPLPDPGTVCRAEPSPQWIPLHLVWQIVADWSAASALILQGLLGAAVFVPAGLVMRRGLRLSLPVTAVIATGLSLLIEVTQLTGVWGIYRCPYRAFDVDDVIVNVAGALLGFAIAPVFSRQRPEDSASTSSAATGSTTGSTSSTATGSTTGSATEFNAEPAAGTAAMPGGLPTGSAGYSPTSSRSAYPVTGARRVLGMVIDVAIVKVVAMVLWIPLGTALATSGIASSRQLAADWIPVALQSVSAAIFLVAVPLIGHGATVGQMAVLLRPQTEAGTFPTKRARLIRAATGSGGFFLLSALGDLATSVLSGFATTLAVATLVVAFAGDHRGLSHLAARIRLVDAREPMRKASPADRWAGQIEVRRLSTAVITFAALLHLAFLGLLGLLEVGGSMGLATALVALAAFGAASVGVVLFLLLNGAAMVRREGRSLGNLLTLVVGIGFCFLTALTLAALFAGWSVLVVPVATIWAIVAYASFLFFSFAGFGLFYAHRRPRLGADSVIALGSRVFGTSVPPLLASRLDRAQQTLEQQLAAGFDTVLVCSGGQGRGEDVPEAVAMADYLIKAGVATDLVRREEKSRTTDENLTLSLELLREEGRGERVIVVTNDFHAFRASLITRELGLSAQVVGSPTARYFLPSALLREFVGVLSRNPWPHVVVVGLITLFGVLIAS